MKHVILPILFMLASTVFNLTVSAQNVFKVTPDQGVEVNALPKAITANGPGIYELQRGGIYYIEAKYVFDSEVVIRAEEGTGDLPMIQPIPDALGSLPADLFRINKNLTFENIYICGKAEMTGNILQRIFRIDGSDVTLKFKGCFIEYCLNFCIRTDNIGSKIYLDNCTIRNLAMTSDPANGRLVDTRGNEADIISITDCTIYNTTGHVIRFDNTVANYVAFKNNTMYNLGYRMEIASAMNVVIENNLIINMGWKAGYDPAVPGAFWDIKSFTDTDTKKFADARMTIRNNNVYTTPEIENLYVKYPDNIQRGELSNTGITMRDETNQLIFENNFSESITFDHPSPMPMTYIEKFFEVQAGNMQPWADLEFFVDEDGEPGFTNGETYTFNYPANTRSATASTTGGPLGAPLWKVTDPSGNIQQKADSYSIYPNPATDYVMITSVENNLKEIRIYNNMGSLVLTSALASNQNRIELQELPAGVYFYQIAKNGAPAAYGKLIIK